MVGLRDAVAVAVTDETKLCDAVHEWYERDPLAFPPDVSDALLALIESNGEKAVTALLEAREMAMLASRRYNPIGGDSHRAGEWVSECRNCGKGRRSHPGGVCP